MKTTIPQNSVSSLLLIPLALGCFALGPLAQAQLSPPPDGGYANENTAEGDFTLGAGTGGMFNSAFGFAALADNTGSFNTGIGGAAMFAAQIGNFNTATGYAALYLNSGSDNTATGFDALNFNTFGGDNTADGFMALFKNDTGTDNTAVGSQALFSNTGGEANTAVGFEALLSNTAAGGNTGLGFFALGSSTTASRNTAIGTRALDSLNTGDFNIGLGFQAGSNLDFGSHNIFIGNEGELAAESNIIRIGDKAVHTATFIAGIEGAAAGTDAVFVDSNGQLGVGVPSSARFKTEIKPMDKASEAILALKPVTFRYKKELDPKSVLRFGLVAEEVEKVNPELVGRDAKGQVTSVRYDAVNAMLLNEFLKEHRTVQKQQKEIDALKAELKEQKALIQRVSDKVELNKPAPQTVLNQ